jgi:hypothetical protein
MENTLLIEAILGHEDRTVQDIMNAKAYALGHNYASSCSGDIRELIKGLLEGFAYPERDTVSKWVDERIDLTEACVHFTRGMEGC